MVSRSTPVRALLYYISITNGLTPTRSEAGCRRHCRCAGNTGPVPVPAWGATRLRAPVRQHNTSAEPLRWRWRSGCTPLAVTAPASSDAPLLRSTKQPRQICLGTAHVCTALLVLGFFLASCSPTLPGRRLCRERPTRYPCDRRTAMLRAPAVSPRPTRKLSSQRPAHPALRREVQTRLPPRAPQLRQRPARTWAPWQT